jgi:hypothetical protein
MRAGITFEVSPPDRLALERVIGDRNSAQKLVWRALIILASGEGLGITASVRETGKSSICVALTGTF